MRICPICQTLTALPYCPSCARMHWLIPTKCADQLRVELYQARMDPNRGGVDLVIESLATLLTEGGKGESSDFIQRL